MRPMLGAEMNCDCQNFQGGWRYEPAPTGADISVTIMQVMALRGAKDSGLHVPDVLLSGDHGKVDAWRREHVR